MDILTDFISRIPLTWLQALPLTAYALAVVLSVFLTKGRGGKTCALFLYFTALALLGLHRDTDVKTLFTFAALYGSVFTLFSPLLRVRVAGANKKRKDSGEENEKREAFELLGSRPPVLPTIERVERPVEPPTAENDLQLDHVMKILKKLQRMKLSGGDRLETDVIYNSVRLLEGRRLTAEETSRLNDQLATLLKLMGKYSV